MRLGRATPGLSRKLALALAAFAVAAAWPQESAPPTVDHSRHKVVNVPLTQPIPSLVVRLMADDVDGFNLFLETRDYLFTPGDVNSENVPNQGHAHLYVNGEKIARLYSPWQHLPLKIFREGVNRLQVELNANDHSIWGIAGEPIGADVLVDTLDADGDPIVREPVSYTLDWRWGRAKPRPAGGWEVVSDLGYRVRVSSGRLVTRNLELLPCHTMPAMTPMAALGGWLTPVTVYAGHSSLLPNQSKISTSYEEDLADPKALFLEARTVTDPEYCQGHYLIARAKGTDLSGRALEVAGTWSRDGGAEVTEFQIETSAAYGEIKDLLSVETGAPSTQSIVGGVEATVERSLETFFDGVDFAAADDHALGMQVMRNIVGSTRVLARRQREALPQKH